MTSIDTTRPEVWFLTSEIEGERAGSFRQERWARVFLEAGAVIRIFNVQGATGLIDRTFDNRDAFDAFRADCRAKARPAASVREGWYVGAVRALKHLLLADFYLPNILKLLSLGRAGLKNGRRVVIFCSSPPFALAAAGYVLKRLFPKQVVLAVDMRDAWALHTSLGGIKPVKRAIERTVLRLADVVSTVSFGLAREFRDRYGVHVEVLYNVATHYFEQPDPAPVDWLALNPALTPGRQRFIYTGSTPTGFYDLGAIARGVVALRRSRPDLADRVQLVFVGACHEMRREAEQAGVTHDDIAFVAHVPHKTATAIQQAADALLFLAYDGEDNKGVVSTKFFEYLALQKPVLPMGLRKGSDVDQLLTRLCGTSFQLLSSDDVCAMLSRLAEEGPAPLPVLKSETDLLPLFTSYRTYADGILKASQS